MVEDWGTHAFNLTPRVHHPKVTFTQIRLVPIGVRKVFIGSLRNEDDDGYEDFI